MSWHHTKLLVSYDKRMLRIMPINHFYCDMSRGLRATKTIVGDCRFHRDSARRNHPRDDILIRNLLELEAIYVNQIHAVQLKRMS